MHLPSSSYRCSRPIDHNNVQVKKTPKFIQVDTKFMLGSRKDSISTTSTSSPPPLRSKFYTSSPLIFPRPPPSRLNPLAHYPATLTSAWSPIPLLGTRESVVFESAVHAVLKKVHVQYPI